MSQDVDATVEGQFKFFSVQILSLLITTFFLATWLGVQYVVNWILAKVDPSGIDWLVSGVFQVIFAITTLVPILVYYYVDISLIIIRARKRVSKELESS